MNVLPKTKLKFFLTFLLFLFSFVFAVKPLQAAELDAACVGREVAKYMNAVIDGVKEEKLVHIKLLSPAFNMTSPYLNPIVNAMADNNAKFGDVVGIAGNAYNFQGKRVTQWVEEAMANPNLEGKPVMVTETGKIDFGIPELKEEMGKIQRGSSGGVTYLGALLFNAFNTNPGWSSFALYPNPDNVAVVFNNNCGNIGANSALFYNQPTAANFYSPAKSHKMRFVLSIANNDVETVVAGLDAANQHGLTPIIRIGTKDGGSGGFDDPKNYTTFLKGVDSRVSFTVYAIAGPNEPEDEHWAATKCSYADELTVSGSPIPKPYVPCNETRPDALHPLQNQFHSLRPYQASPCDPDVKEATLQCGNDLIVKKTYEIKRGSDTQGCVETCSSPTSCTYRCEEQVKVAIDLADADLPIAGNTQLVPNSINKTDALDPTTRMEEYVSWYLNGVPFRAEETPGKRTNVVSPSTQLPVGPAVNLNTAKIMPLGDSITSGVAGQPNGGYRGPLQNFLRSAGFTFEFVGSSEEHLFDNALSGSDKNHEGHGGKDSGYILRNIEGYLKKSQPTLVLLHIGTNDLGQSCTIPAATTDNIIGIIKAVNSFDPNTTTLVARIVRRGDCDVTSLNNKIQGEVEKRLSSGEIKNAAMVAMDGAGGPVPGTADFHSDGIHPKPLGYEKMAQFWFNAIQGYQPAGSHAGTTAIKSNEYNLVDFAGPLRKLLAKSSQETARQNQVNQAGVTRHNQIVECKIPLLGIQVPCYEKLSAVLDKVWLTKNEQFTPFSSTEDRTGETIADISNTEQPSGIGVTVADVNFDPDETVINTAGADDLYFAHMQEDSELASLLQKTYTPSGSEGFSGNTGNTTAYTPTLHCEEGGSPVAANRESRTNPGDDLFGDYNFKDQQRKKDYKQVTGTLTFTSSFNCTFPPTTTGLNQACYNSCYQDCIEAGGSTAAQCENKCTTQCTTATIPTCTKEAYAAVSVFTKVPKVQELWERLVNGSQAVFKRMYPGALVSSMEIKDLPASAKASYGLSAENESPNVEVMAGDPAKNRPGSSAQIFIPHLGGIYDYFLKGIQTALRPYSGSVPTGATTTGDCTAPQPYSSELTKIIDQAIKNGGAATKVPRSVLEAIYAIEGFTKFTNPNDTCSKNASTALGLMSITDYAYQQTVPPDQRAQNEEGQCRQIPGKLNRCNPVDSMELAARVLLLKVGLWQNYQATGSISSKNDIYRAAYGYYGCYDVDKMTMDRGNDDWGNSQGPVPDNKDGCTNYSEVVCARSGYCRSAADYPWPRPADTCQLPTPAQCKAP